MGSPDGYGEADFSAMAYSLNFNECSQVLADNGQTQVCPTGEVAYRVTKTGYATTSGSVTVSRGQTKTVVVKLVSN
jgi:hypothetical protein